MRTIIVRGPSCRSRSGRRPQNLQGVNKPTVIDLSDSSDGEADVRAASTGNVNSDDEDPDGEIEDFLFSNALDDVEVHPVFVAYAVARTDQDKENAAKVWGVPVAAPWRPGPGSRRDPRTAPGHVVQIIDSDDGEGEHDDDEERADACHDKEDEDSFTDDDDGALISDTKQRGRKKAIPSHAVARTRASRRRVPAARTESSDTDRGSSPDHLDPDEIEEFRALQEERGVLTLEDPTAVYDTAPRSRSFTAVIAPPSELPPWFTRAPPPLHRLRLRAGTDWRVPHVAPPRMDTPITFAWELLCVATYAVRARMKITATGADVPLVSEYDAGRPETPGPFPDEDCPVRRAWAHARYWLKPCPDVRLPDMERLVRRNAPEVWPSMMPPDVLNERTVASDLEQVQFWAEQVLDVVDLIAQAADLRVRWGEEEPDWVVEVENGGADDVKVVNELIAWCLWLRELGTNACTLVTEDPDERMEKPKRRIVYLMDEDDD
ncbi:hypothetical protein AMAG_13739 [Allomyces macrogynus ATCC 38327]|uniref:Uncharacterized protein n=1 Tax=Allomyces macrogynus (strain ATCC 38327) TaxID=578462 RepID=A0A0L0T3F6_ALLM3|nr:hypothetical protein AMAG_13739 [Allomyces macrogynus ATCC 38327]|eukprot:KNE69373.1 hypothetical protein AMAG_13739 [Allomyces macrogynus ATCC 38327]